MNNQIKTPFSELINYFSPKIQMAKPLKMLLLYCLFEPTSFLKSIVYNEKF
jgi:hypothetical protein